MFPAVLLMAAMISQPVQLLIDHVGPEDRPVRKLVLYASGSLKESPLPADCPKAALCVAVESAAWNQMVGAAESALTGPTSRNPYPVGTFRFRLVGGAKPMERTIQPPQSSEFLSTLARYAAPPLKIELERRAALGR